MPWFRFYTDTPDDLKVSTLPKTERWLWPVVMCLARESPEPGKLLVKGAVVTEAHIAHKAGPGYSPKEVAAALKRMAARDMLHRDGDVWVVTHFTRRQYLSDSSADRTAEYRRRHRDDAPPSRGRHGDGVGDDFRPSQERPILRAPATETETEYRDRAQTTASSPSEHPPDRQPAEHAMHAPPAAAESAPARSTSLEPAYSSDFEAWWPTYPRHREKVDAFKAYQSTRKDGATAEDLLAASRNCATYVEEQGTEERFIPLPATFLGPSRKWLDFRDGVPRPAKRRNGTGPRVGRATHGSTDALLDRVFGSKP